MKRYFFLLTFFIFGYIYCYAQSDSSTSQNQKVYSIVEIMPSFPGGEEKMMQYVSKNLKKPKKNKREGVVIVRFIVAKSGKVIDATIYRGLGAEQDSAAIEVVRSMPDWSPGTQDGRPVNVNFQLPIHF